MRGERRPGPGLVADEQLSAPSGVCRVGRRGQRRGSAAAPPERLPSDGCLYEKLGHAG